jgi:hypothetical protein
MDTPEPGSPERPAPAAGTAPITPPMSLEQSARALHELHTQIVELNARLEVLNLLMKLGVR